MLLLSGTNETKRGKRMDIFKIIAAITAILTIVLNIYFFKYNNRHKLRITNFKIWGEKTLLKLDDNSIENIYSESFIHCFSHINASFRAENHTKSDIEIYGFYLQIRFFDRSDSIMIPLETYTRGDRKNKCFF